MGTRSHSRAGGWPLSLGSELSALPPLGDSTAVMTSPWGALHFISNACIRSFREELQFGISLRRHRKPQDPARQWSRF